MTTTARLTGVGGIATTWEDIYGVDATFDVGAVAGFTITQSTAGPLLTLTKSNAGAGAVLVTNNAGTGIDLSVSKTEASATGIVMNTYHNSASAADNDVIFEHLVRGNDDGVPAAVSYGRVRFAATDVSAGTEDASYVLSLMLAGTLRQELSIVGDLMLFGTAQAAAVISSNGATDLVLETNSGTDSGTITITDAANGNIQIAPNGTGILDLNSGFDIDAGGSETCTIDVVGTDGDGLAVSSSTITSGAVVMINHSVSGTLAGGQLLDIQIDSASYYTFGETAFNIVGTAGSNVSTITAGDVVYSDTSLTITDADNAASFSVTNNTATTANVFLFTGSGVFTGTGATAFHRIVQSGATSGDVAAIIANGLTTGNALLLSSSGTIVDGGAMLSIVADSATTAGATSGGLFELSADALTTGWAFDVTSTSLNFAGGALFNAAHVASGTLTAAKTGYLGEFLSSRTHTAATAISDDFDTLTISRTNVINNAGGTLNAAGSVLRLENIGTQTAGTLADTVIGLEVVMTGGATQDGIGISLTHSGTTAGRAALFTLSHTTLDGIIQVTANSVTTGNLIVADMNGLTEGIGLELTHTTSVITTGSVCRLTSTGVDTGTAQGTLLDLVSSGTTAATVVQIVADSLATGIGFFGSFDGLTTGEGFSLTHTTSVIADGGSLFRLSSTGIDTGGATNGTLVDLASTAQAAGVVMRLAVNGLTTGTGFLVTSSGTITSAGEGLVNIVGTGITTGDALKIDLTEGTLTTGNYLNCYDDTGAASVFRIAENGATTILGAAGTILTVTEGDVVLSNGAYASAREQVTIGAGLATFAVDSNVVEVTGDGGGNSVTTITGGVAGQIVVLIFVDGNVTIVDDNTHAANTIDIVGANTTFADDATLTLVFDGTSWYELARSVND